MKIVSYNIQYGFGQDGNNDLSRIADEIKTADIIALQEIERFWERTGMVDQVLELTQLLPEYHWVFGANLDMDASFKDDNNHLVNRRRQFGTMIMSRFPILSSRNFPLPKFGTLTQHSIQQGILEAVIDLGKGPIRFYSVNLSHLCSETRLPQVEAMHEIFRKAPSEGGAWCGGHPDPDAGWTEGNLPPMPHEMILLGDMNFDNKSPEYTHLTGPFTRKYGRLYNLEGLIDAWVASGKNENEGSTYPGGPRIDHCFMSSSLRDKIKSVWVDESAKGSDHWPLWIEMNL